MWTASHETHRHLKFYILLLLWLLYSVVPGTKLSQFSPTVCYTYSYSEKKSFEILRRLSRYVFQCHRAGEGQVSNNHLKVRVCSTWHLRLIDFLLPRYSELFCCSNSISALQPLSPWWAAAGHLCSDYLVVCSIIAGVHSSSHFPVQ